MKRIVTASEMKQLDLATIEGHGMPGMLLMERAALETVRIMEQYYEKNPAAAKRILVICGGGNNGGDGVAITRILHLHGFSAEYTLTGNPDHYTEDLKKQIFIAQSYGVPCVTPGDYMDYTTIVDAVFGVGLSREVTGSYAEILSEMNAATGWKVAVDIPSGIDGTTGKILGTAFHADLTVTYGYRKAGLCLYPGRSYAGQIHVADVGIYGEPEEGTSFAIQDADLTRIPERTPDGNKGTFGKVLVVGGSEGMAGAAYFSASAVLASGAGMVKVQTVKDNAIALQTLLPEAILSTGDHETDYKKAFEWCDALVIGPGLSTAAKNIAKTGTFLFKAFERQIPVVLDADGLNLLAENPLLLNYLSSNVILTPHMGEMSRLTGKSIAELKTDPAAHALEYAAQTGAIVVLKDACTVVASPDGKVYYNLSGNEAMATAGSGDVLSGILGALAAGFSRQGIEINTAELAALGVYLHGKAGDMARNELGTRGVKASDLIRYIPAVLKMTEKRGDRR
ncbi:MAG: NAD(P)H-hydrate dehydratase [Clostridiales bacterium]|nr:NAD(P)H-hydrate dehydratase [Candidatus Blautia equi]